MPSSQPAGYRKNSPFRLTALPRTGTDLDTGMETSQKLECRIAHILNRETWCWCETLQSQHSNVSWEGHKVQGANRQKLG